MSIEAAYTNVAPGFVVGFVAQNPGPILTRLWDLDDGTLVTNQAVVSHAWNEPGSCTVRLTGYNDSFPEGVTATVQVEVPGNVYYVNQANPTPMFPYTSWATAATNIQEAINAASTVGRLVLATHGVYASGGAATQGNNRIALTDAVRVQSVNGPDVTVIQGATGIRCACVGTYAVLSGFTLTKGNETRGGGVRLGMLYNCTLINNRASDSGGGEANSTLHNCIVYFNNALQGANDFDGTLYYSCTTPLPSEGAGNITKAPLFADLAAGNSHLRHGSAGIDAAPILARSSPPTSTATRVRSTAMATALPWSRSRGPAGGVG
jgi:PKD repeat protein